MSGLPSDEVAEDYKGSLEDLVSNDRYQISNLTLIAKENIEHAEAISRVLQNHINRAPPARKLPALYVLDSIAKNVGSPYTVYFGRNLHQIFMLAYSQVDGPVRRKLEEMLKTWREPVPGSLSQTPVFPHASTQSIVDSLNKFRTPLQATTRYQSTPVPAPARVLADPRYRNTPTPPQSYPPLASGTTSQIRSPRLPTVIPQQAYTQTPPLSYSQPYPAQMTPFYSQQPPVQMTQYHAPTPQPRPASSGGVDLRKLHLDIDDLTTDAKIECATHPTDAGARRKLASLQTLKEILDSGNASERDLVDIRNTIMQKMAEKMAAQQQNLSQTAIPPVPASNSYAPQSSIQQPAAPATAATTLFNSTNLAELLRATAGQQQAGQPPNYYAHAQSAVVTPVPAATAAPTTSENPLLAQLRASGLLSAAPTPPQGATHSIPGFAAFATDPVIEVSLTSASIRMPRPHLVSTFLNTWPNQCSTCGKRFTSDEHGKAKKARHLDWHFKTKARMLEAEKRGQNRSWYVDEREWIASKEFEDDAGPVDGTGAPTNGTSVAVKKTQDYVRVPADPVLRSLPCPIDQEPFKSEWSEDVQDFIWKDAVHVGGRYYHASCYAEVTRGREKDGVLTPVGAFGRTATPDSVLGKRKAEEDSNGIKSKIKLEAIQSA